MPDWAVVASLATAGGTLVLAIATFSAVRSANRSARTAERTLQVGIRPMLFQSRLQDPALKIMWADQHWANVGGGRATVEALDGVIYLAMSLRNVGAGIAVLHGWDPVASWRDAAQPHAEPGEFRVLTRDLYIPAADVGLWQGAIRDPSEQVFTDLKLAIDARQRITIDLLYSDHEGGQRTISRFSVLPVPGADWLCSVVKHWNLDRSDPR
jgi:hypothetical protein